MKKRQALHEVLSVSFIIVLIILILIAYPLVSTGEETQPKKQEPARQDLLKVANKTADVVKLLARGGVIVEGPKKATTKDRERFPALFSSFGGNTYFMKIEGAQKGMIVIMNNTNVLDIVPVTSMSFI